MTAQTPQRRTEKPSVTGADIAMLLERATRAILTSKSLLKRTEKLILESEGFASYTVQDVDSFFDGPKKGSTRRTIGR